MTASDFLVKARQAVTSAQLLLERKLLNCAANRAYYALFHAARAALIHRRQSSAERRWAHDALQAAFSKLLHADKRYPSHLKSYLITQLVVREMADYDSGMISSRSADLAVRRAAEFVSTVETVVAS